MSHRILITALLMLGLALVVTAVAGPSTTAKTDESKLVVPGEAGDYAIITTNMGEIMFKLNTKEAPKTVANFVGLATGKIAWIDPKTGEKVMRPYYDGLSFHRVIPNVLIQTGDAAGDGAGGPGFAIQDEFNRTLKHDVAGVVSMANSGPNTAGGQFFITTKAAPWLDGKYAVFGKVIGGQETVDKIAQLPVDKNNRPITTVIIDRLIVHHVK